MLTESYRDIPEADVELFCVQDESQALANVYVSGYKACKPKACMCLFSGRQNWGRACFDFLFSLVYCT